MNNNRNIITLEKATEQADRADSADEAEGAHRADVSHRADGANTADRAGGAEGLERVSKEAGGCEERNGGNFPFQTKSVNCFWDKNV